jgi:sulfatase maturation enzyme AslB (radical SAM superfamily)
MSVTTVAPPALSAPPPKRRRTRLWCDLTRKCQLACTHCLNESGPTGTHGTMTLAHWLRVLDEAVRAGFEAVQFFGGEPTMHPEFVTLVDHACDIGLDVEVYSNLVSIRDDLWDLFQRRGVTLATSYYSDRAAEHNAITRRKSHARTRANIQRAAALGVPLRVGIVTATEGQRVEEAKQDALALGAASVRVDRVREFGRGACGQEPDAGNLCGACGDGRASVAPDGTVSPCVFSTWMGVGQVQEAGLAAIVSGAVMLEAVALIQATAVRADPCDPKDDDDDDNEDECGPGFPGSSCSPRN